MVRIAGWVSEKANAMTGRKQWLDKQQLLCSCVCWVQRSLGGAAASPAVGMQGDL